MAFNSGMELKVKGVPKSNPVRFTLDVGHSEDVIALHLDLRFNYFGDERIIILNSMDNGAWQDEQREKAFPFEPEKEFEMTISFTNDKFYINLHDGKMIQFPNRLRNDHYKFLWMRGDVMVSSIQIK